MRTGDLGGELFLVVDVEGGRLTLRSLRDSESHSYEQENWLEIDDHSLAAGDIIEVEPDDTIAMCTWTPARVEERKVTRWKKRRLHVEGIDTSFTADEASQALAVPTSILSELEDETVLVLRPTTKGEARLIELPRVTLARIESDLQQKADEARTAAARVEARHRKQAREAAWNDPERFVNPYTFIPLPAADGMVRGAPNGHHVMPATHLSGSIDVKWRAETPILHRAPSGTDGRFKFPRHHSSLALPGSSVKGAVRSMHETLFGGCMRVLDLDLTSSHREQPNNAQRQLAVVESELGDETLTLRMCTDTVWVHLDVLRNALGGSDDIRTGARLDIDESTITNSSLGRREVGRDGKAAEGGDWILLVTDTGVRQKAKNIYFAAARLTDAKNVVSDPVVRAYRDAAEGTDDERVGNDDLVPVKQHGKRIALRQPVRRDLPRGTVLWAEFGHSKKIERLTRAQIWRIAGSYPVRDRVDPVWQPCGSSADLEGLCPSCAVFGSAGDESSTVDRRGVVSYRGHVRFGPAVALDGHTDRIELAPMGSPRPSSSQFYLEKPTHNLPSEVDDPALSYWGSQADSPSPRKINGRKYYWHGFTDDADKPARHRKRARQSDKMSSSVEVLPVGTELSCTIRFDNLSQTQLGGLIAAIDPEKLLFSPTESPEAAEGLPIRSRLGGGRPFGFGTVKVSGINLKAQSSTQRYGGAAQIDLDIDHLVALAADTTPDSVQAIWPSARSVLAVGMVNPDRIWYPPAEFWTDPPTRDVSQRFDESYRFFGRTKGERQRNSDIPLVTLPKPTDIDVTLPIIER